MGGGDNWQAAYLHVRQWSPRSAGSSPSPRETPDLLRGKAENLVIDELLCHIHQASLTGCLTWLRRSRVPLRHHNPELYLLCDITDPLPFFYPLEHLSILLPLSLSLFLSLSLSSAMALEVRG